VTAAPQIISLVPGTMVRVTTLWESQREYIALPIE